MSERERTDWAGLKALSEDEIERIAEADPDNPATIGLPPVKTSIHASFERDVVDVFKQDGRGYQTRMNAVLRHYLEAPRAAKAKG